MSQVNTVTATASKPTLKDSSDWSNKIQPFGTTSVYSNAFGSPASVVHGTRMFVVWPDHNTNLLFGTYDGVTFSDPRYLKTPGSDTPISSLLAPALIDSGDVLHIVVTDPNGFLYHYIFNDNFDDPLWAAQPWPSRPQTKLGVTVGSVPVASTTGSSGSVLTSVWVALGSNFKDQALYTANWTPSKEDPTTGTWGAQGGPLHDPYGNEAVPNQAPAIMTLDDYLVLCYQNASDDKIYAIRCSGDAAWTTMTQPEVPAHWQYTGGGVACSSFFRQRSFGVLEVGVGSLAFLKDRDTEILVCYYHEVADDWTDNESTTEYSHHNPAIVAFQDSLFVWFVPTDSNTLSYTTRSVNTLVHPSVWMSYISNRQTELYSLAIPGTHDSCTYTVVWNTIDQRLLDLKTQTLSITEQLMAGIRFFDLRLGLKDGVVCMFHASYYVYLSLADVLTAMSAFLRQYKQETILACMNKDDDDTNAAALWIAVETLMNSAPFTGLFNPGTSLPNLQQAAGSIVLLRRMPATDLPETWNVGFDLTPFPDNETSSYQLSGYTSSGARMSAYVQDLYQPDGPTIVQRYDNKMGAIASTLKQSMAPAANTWYINFTSASTWQALSPEDYAMRDQYEFAPFGKREAINTQVTKFFEGLNDGHPPHGIVVMDFPEWPNNALIPAIIAQNF